MEDGQFDIEQNNGNYSVGAQPQIGSQPGFDWRASRLSCNRQYRNTTTLMSL
jgi:hypothetical protein